MLRVPWAIKEEADTYLIIIHAGGENWDKQF